MNNLVKNQKIIEAYTSGEGIITRRLVLILLSNPMYKTVIRLGASRVDSSKKIAPYIVRKNHQEKSNIIQVLIFPTTYYFMLYSKISW